MQAAYTPNRSDPIISQFRTASAFARFGIYNSADVLSMTVTATTLFESSFWYQDEMITIEAFGDVRRIVGCNHKSRALEVPRENPY